MVLELSQLNARVDVGARADYLLLALELVVLHQFQAMAIVDERVPGNTSGGVISLRETLFRPRGIVLVR